MKKQVKFIDFVNTGIFHPDVLINYGFSYDELLAILKRKKPETWYTALVDDYRMNKIITEGYCAMKRIIENRKTGKTVTLFYLSMPAFDHSSYDHIKLAHECLHLCQYMLPDFLNRDKEHEAEAYLHTHLMSQIIDLINAKTKR